MNPGDQVQLKSGGPTMTVVATVDTLTVCCGWFDNDDKYNQAHFPKAALKPK